MTKQDDTPIVDEKLLAKIEELEAQVTELQTAKEEAENTKMRALADLQNQQRRESENRAQWGSMAVATFIKTVLPSFLELRLGAEHTDDETVQKVIEKFFTELQKSGLTTIEPNTGDDLDTEFHEVMMTAEGDAGKVVQCLEPGWKYNQMVIIPAKVSAATV